MTALRKVGFSAPSVDGQADVIRMAHKMARIEPQSISYIETHGHCHYPWRPYRSGGIDPGIRKHQRKILCPGFCKTNIGHLDTAAGAAGFIKTVLALMHRQLPPGLHFAVPNSRIDFENTPFYVNTTLKEWENHDYPLRAGSVPLASAAPTSMSSWKKPISQWRQWVSGSVGQ